MMKLDSIRKTYLADHSEIAFALCGVTEDRSKAVLRIGFRYNGDFMYDWDNAVGAANHLWVSIYYKLTKTKSQKLTAYDVL